MQFIKLNTIHPTDVMQDTQHHILIDMIVGIQVPTDIDRKQRSEIKALVHTKLGVYAVAESPESILEELKTVSYS